MADSTRTYRQIFGALSLFGGVHVIAILSGIVRSKVLAVVLGPVGTGIHSLLVVTTGMVGGITNCGLGTSGVKDVAAAHTDPRPERLGHLLAVFRRLIWATGLGGAIVVAVLSPVLSRATFGNEEYTLAFVWLAVTMLFAQLTTGGFVLLQGLRRLRRLAQANVTGNLLSLAVTIPVYVVWKLDAIVPCLILSSFLTLLVTWLFSRNQAPTAPAPKLAVLVSEGRSMLATGFMYSLSGFSTLAASYLVRMYIQNTGGLEQVGLYAAGYTMIISYVSIILTALGTDFYPRLAAVADNIEARATALNQQLEIALIVLGPLVLLLLVFARPAILVLYAGEFAVIERMVQTGAAGLIFMCTGWIIAYIYLATGQSRLYFLNEAGKNVYILALSLLGYSAWRLTGVGISFTVGYLLYAAQMVILAHRQFRFRLSRGAGTLMIVYTLLIATTLALGLLVPTPWSYVIGGAPVVLGCGYSAVELNRRLRILG